MDDVTMDNALVAADEIQAAALQIMNRYGVDAKLVPLVMGTVSHRLESFAIGAMAHEIAEHGEHEQEELDG